MSTIASITTSANGFGLYSAAVEFEHTLSESDPRPEFNLDSQWSTIRRHARTAIVNRIADDEQKWGESIEDARARVRATLKPLIVHAQDIDSMNRWHGVTFQEVAS